MLETVPSRSLLGATARWTAAARAQESARDDGLFRDPWAAALAGEEGAIWLAQRQGNVLPMIIRTRFFDDFLERAVSEPGVRQGVILAAGLDTRALRLDWPQGTRLFELDQPEVLAYKEGVLAEAGAVPACDRRITPADLTSSWRAALTGCGFDPSLPSAWLLEGFLFYISNDAIARVLDEVSALAAPGSWVGFDIVNSATLTSPYTKAWVEMQAQMGAPWTGTMDDPEAFMGERGWEVTLSQPGAPDAHFGRWNLPSFPVKMANMPHNWYVVGKKLD